jgi:hypothetical protein
LRVRTSILCHPYCNTGAWTTYYINLQCCTLHSVTDISDVTSYLQ